MRRSTDERSTSPQVAAGTATDVRIAAHALDPMDDQPAVVQRRYSVQVVAGFGLLAIFLVTLVVSVVWVSEDSKHPLVQVNPTSPATTSAPSPSPTVATAPIPLPEATTQPATAIDTPDAPVDPMPPSQLTAETMTPPPPPMPRLPRLHDLFPQLFPDG